MINYFKVLFLTIIFVPFSCTSKNSSAEIVNEETTNYEVKIITQKSADVYHHYVILLGNKKDTMCINKNILPTTLTDDLYTYIDKHINSFSITVELGGAHPEGFHYFVFNDVNNSLNFNIDSIILSNRDYDLADEENLFYNRIQTFTKPQLKNISLCNFKVYNNEELPDFSYLGIKDMSNQEMDSIFYNYCHKSKDEIGNIFSLEYIKKSIEMVPLSKKSLECYNDISFYLEETGKHKEAASILEKIINQYPDRVVAYLNLADAYWGDNKKREAKLNYQKYIDFMKSQNKNMDKIPQRVYDRIKE